MKFSSTVTAALALGAAQAVPNPKSSDNKAVAVRRSTSGLAERELGPAFQIRTRAVENLLFKRVKGGEHVDGSGRIVKVPGGFNGPHKVSEVKKLAEKLQADPSKALKETIAEVNTRPRGKDASGNVIKWKYEIEGDDFKEGEQGLLIKQGPKTDDNPSGNIIFMGYGDGMAFHADHELALSERYPEALDRGYQLRDTPFPRSETLKGLEGDGPLDRDENPIRQFDAPEGLHSVMDVPPGESSMQGTMAQAAKKFVLEHGGIIRPFDNRKDTKSIRGRIVRGAEGDNNGRGEPTKISVPFDSDDFIARMVPISRDIMPAALRSKIEAYEKANKGKGKGKGKSKRSLTKRAYDNDVIVTFSPFFNDAMTGADKYNPDSYTPFTNLDTFFSSLYPDLTAPTNKKRDIISDISSQEGNATDSGQDDDKQFIEQLILAKEIAQNNLTATLLPYVDAVMNGSSHPMAESIAWNLYSIVLPSVSVISPFAGPLDSLSDMFANTTDSNKAWANDVSHFNNFVYGRAWTACNATGLLGPLYQLNAELSSYDQSLWPEDQWTVDEHTQEPFIDYLQQWFAYNEMPFTPGNGSDHVITPDWVLQELNLNYLNDTKTLNGTSITINGTTIDLSKDLNSTAVAVPLNTTSTVRRRWHA